MAGGPFSTKDADVNNDFNIAINYLNVAANKSRLVLTPGAQSMLTQLTTWLGVGTPAPAGSWNEQYPKSQNAATNTTTITTTKNGLRKEMESGLRFVYADIPQSVLTQVDRDTLKLPIHDHTPTHVALPANAPVIAVVERGHLYVIISITDPKNPHTQAKPDGVEATDLESAFQSKDDAIAIAVQAAADAAAAKVAGNVVPVPVVTFPQQSDYRHLGNTGKFLYKVTYTDIQIGGTDHIRARYLNTRKEPGDWSEVITVVVS